MSDLQDKILMLTGLGFDAYQVAQMLECSDSYVRSTVSKERKRRELKAWMDIVAALEKAYEAQ